MTFSDNANLVLKLFLLFDQNFKFCTILILITLFSRNKFLSVLVVEWNILITKILVFKIILRFDKKFRIWTVLRLFCAFLSWNTFSSVLAVKRVFLITQNLVLKKFSNFAPNSDVPQFFHASEFTFNWKSRF